MLLGLFKFLFKGRVEKEFIKLKNDDDLQSTITDMHKHAKKLKDDVKNHPDRDLLDPELLELIDGLQDGWDKTD